MTLNSPGYVVLSLDLHDEKTREGLRKRVVLAFLDEAPGAKYHYLVETLKDGRRIYLKRPTFLNKGLDFQIWVES